MPANSIADPPDLLLAPDFDFRQSMRTLLPFLFPGITQCQAAASAAAGSELLACALIEHREANRAAVERFIGRCFEREFGSRLRAFMPRLFSLQDRSGRIIGAFGLRSATRRLYLEQYLEEPIEQSIGAMTGRSVERKSIVEVGHFSGGFPGSMRAMICLLTEHLYCEGFEWVAFTGTAALRNAFRRMGLAPTDIREAGADKLPPHERAAWGSYYDHAPRVLVGNVRQGYETLLQGAANRRSGR